MLRLKLQTWEPAQKQEVKLYARARIKVRFRVGAKARASVMLGLG